jgi:hypothetical protein
MPRKPDHFIDPIVAYPHPEAPMTPSPTKPEGISVTGGYVYRGKAIEGLAGRYVFADWSRTVAFGDGVLFTASRSGSGAEATWKQALLSVSAPDSPNGKLGYIVALGEDADGELYVMTKDRLDVVTFTGTVFKLVPSLPARQ